MAYPVVLTGDLLQVKIGCYCQGQAGINVLHLRAGAKTDPALEVTLDEVAETVDDLMEALYKPLLTGVASYYGVQVTRIRPFPRSVSAVAAGNEGPGTGGTAALPLQTSAVITLQTNLAGRSNRGRIYIPFPDETANDNAAAMPTLAYDTLLSNLAATFANKVTFTQAGQSMDFYWVIAKDGGTSTIDLDRARANRKWGTQRRRGNYGQKNVYPPF